MERILFAKIFEKNGSQMLVMKTTDDDAKPCVSVSVEPEGFGVCTASVTFKDNDKGYELRDAFFETIDSDDKAFEFAETMVFAQLREITCAQ